LYTSIVEFWKISSKDPPPFRLTREIVVPATSAVSEPATTSSLLSVTSRHLTRIPLFVPPTIKTKSCFLKPIRPAPESLIVSARAITVPSPSPAEIVVALTACATE
jgi:hypothetical protein